MIRQQMPATLAGLLLGFIVVAVVFSDAVPLGSLLGWSAAVLLVWTLRLVHHLRFDRKSPLRWLNQWRWGVFATAVLWGASAWLFLDRGSNFDTVALITLIFAYCIAAIPVLVTQPGTFAIFLALCLAPVILRIALANDPDAPGFALVMAVIFGLAALVGRNFNRAYDRVVELQRETGRLAAQLQAEKAAADAARREAEVANRAKTQFFAAASHDLRQPLHALGLFAEALRERSGKDDEAVHLVNSINSSVDALDGLFGELLDITKIDAGGVEAVAEHFTIGELFRKLKLHFEPTAFEKGLSLRFRGAQHHALADPLLVERIVRNLLSNAIRYTHDGGVLVAARRRGDRLRLEVWDSGVGIREHERERIFDEFYQVPIDGPKLAPHQRKGLGLGLSIVRRLADLMQAPLTLRSQAGHGTVFTLELPAGRAPRPATDMPRRGLAAGVTLKGRRVLVVEDEPAVLSGLEVLLKSWGAEVLSFDSAAASFDWAEAHAADADGAPHLLVVDYRLESGHTGIEVITALRRRFAGAKLPAIVVTGSLMSSHEQEAQAHDFHLMIKPVVPNKLRAMIAFKLGVR